MRPFPLTVMQGGINRLRVKGAARANMVYDLLNAYVTNAGSISPREGTIRDARLDSNTVGLMAMDGILNVFSTSAQSVPSGYADNILVNPADSTQALSKIWFAKPFMGFPYVVAQFADGSIYSYWLQSNGTWTANTVYFTGNIVTPPTPNGLAYMAERNMPANPTWASNVITSSGNVVEPTVYTGFAYRAVVVTSSPGTDAFTSQTEPTWPTVAGGTVQEFGNFNTTGSNNSSSSSSTNTPLGTSITDRYGDSAEIAGQTGVTSSVTVPTASSQVTTWQPGTVYAPGAVVKPGTNQGAVINAIPNGDFEAGDDGNWIKTGGASITGTTGGATPYQGSFMGLLSCNHNTQSLTMNTYGSVTAGQSVTASAYCSTDASGTDLESFVFLRWYTSGDVFISESSSAGQFGNGSTNNYKKITVTANAPANAARVRVKLQSQNGTSTRDSQWDLVVWSLEQPAAVSNFLYEAVQSSAGTSGTTQPTWPTTAGNTVVDGGVTWEAIGTSIITWQAIPIMQSGSSQPTFPTSINQQVLDPSTYTSQDAHSTDTSMSWKCIDRHILDKKCPNNPATCLGASHVFEGDDDIVDYSAAVDPTDWSSANNAGYLPTGLNNYGDNPVKVLGLYRSNLVVFNAGGYQMWQIDPDPQNMALLDAQPVGSIYTRAAQSAANDLMFLAEVGVRNLGTVGATANMQIGNTGQPVDPLVVAQLKAGVYEPIGLYYPGRGQYWLFFGPQAFVLTINGAGTRAWSRYVFPDTITDWTLNGSHLFLRTAGNLVWKLSTDALQDDMIFGTTTWTDHQTLTENRALDLTSDHGTSISSFFNGSTLMDIRRSVDGGQTWTKKLTSGNLSGGGRVLYLGINGSAQKVWMVPGASSNTDYISTDDGVTWNTGGFVGLSQGCQGGATDGAGRFVCGNSSQEIYSSYNYGSTTSVHTAPWTSGFNAGSIIWDGTQFIALGKNAGGLPAIWTAPPTFTTGGPVWTLVGNRASGTWQPPSTAARTGNFCFTPGFGYTAMVGPSGDIITAPTLLGLTTATAYAPSLGGATLADVFSLGSTLFAGTTSAASIWRSTDAVTWTNDTISPPGTVAIMGYDVTANFYMAITDVTVHAYNAAALTSGTDFKGVIQWPYLDMAALGVNHGLIGVDLIGDGAVDIQIGFREDDNTTFSDNAGFATSLNVTAPYTINVADTIPGDPIPLPCVSPSYTLILTFHANQAWSWEAANFYMNDQRGRGY